MAGGPGSKTAEVFVPSTGQQCQLTELPGVPRYLTTMEDTVVCGGNDGTVAKNCITLTSCGTWEKTTQLKESR